MQVVRVTGDQMRPFVPVENPFVPASDQGRQSQLEVEELLRQKIEETN
jgi:hypothetical protein